LARYGMTIPAFATIVSTREYSVSGRQTYQMYNGNQLLARYPGADGVKTGYTENALQTLVASATRNNRQVFVTVMRSRDRIGDGVPLLDYFFSTYGWRSLDLPQNALNAVPGRDGKPRSLAPRTAGEACLPRWQLPFVRSSVWLDQQASADPKAEDRLGFAGFYLGQRLLAELPLYAR
ncbi:MAG: D-alanyl-D-alanine carboxypeptidase family protein, partial [Chloroflexota bacterium]